MYTSSVASAYFLPLRGLEGAGDGGRLCPSRSRVEKTFPSPFGFFVEPVELSPPALLLSEPDIVFSKINRASSPEREGVML